MNVPNPSSVLSTTLKWTDGEQQSTSDPFEPTGGVPQQYVWQWRKADRQSALHIEDAGRLCLLNYKDGCSSIASCVVLCPTPHDDPSVKPVAAYLTREGAKRLTSDFMKFPDLQSLIPSVRVAVEHELLKQPHFDTPAFRLATWLGD